VTESRVKSIPEGMHTITPHIVVGDAARAAGWYVEALGAEERSRIPVPDADFFVGLSYTHSTRHDHGRLIGYANVFNEDGKWQFYSGNTEAFAYEERTRWGRLVSLGILQTRRMEPGASTTSLTKPLQGFLSSPVPSNDASKPSETLL
jgi:hypothetical protein